MEKADKHGKTALITAARWGHADVVDKLLEAFGDDLAAKKQVLEQKDLGGRTAEEWAMEKGHQELAEKLRKTIEDMPRLLVSILAVEHTSTDTVEVFFAYGFGGQQQSLLLPTEATIGEMAARVTETCGTRGGVVHVLAPGLEDTTPLERVDVRLADLPLKV